MRDGDVKRKKMDEEEEWGRENTEMEFITGDCRCLHSSAIIYT